MKPPAQRGKRTPKFGAHTLSGRGENRRELNKLTFISFCVSVQELTRGGVDFVKSKRVFWVFRARRFFLFFENSRRDWLLGICYVLGKAGDDCSLTFLPGWELCMMELPLHLQRLLTVGGLKISWVNIIKKYLKE